MEGLERFRRTLAFQPCDRPPVIAQVFAHAALIQGRTIEDYRSSAAIAAECQLAAQARYGYDAVFAVLDSSGGDPADFLAEPGEWIWSSVLAKNPDAAAKFYRNIFGYDVFDLPSTDGLVHVVLSNEDYARAGVNALPADKMHRRSHWLNFVRVEDTVATVHKAVALGGRVLVEPHVDRHGGKVALLADPAGAPFGILEWTAADSQVEPK